MKEIVFMIGGFFGGYTKYRFIFNADKTVLNENTEYNYERYVTSVYSAQDSAPLIEQFESIKTEEWNDEYYDGAFCDGTQWNLTVQYSDGSKTECSGSNAYPEHWDKLLDFFGLEHSK
jgi:hypothetical protein